jgi:hypothetical protein
LPNTFNSLIVIWWRFPMTGRIAGWPSLSLTAGCALLCVTLTVSYSLICAVAWSRGPEALQSAAIASVVCGLGALMALLVTGLTKSSANAPVGILAGIMFGMGLPLAAAAALGFTGWLVACFEIALIIETLIGVSVVARRPVAAAQSNQGVS